MFQPELRELSAKKVILFGTGPMASEYLKVLKNFACVVYVVGRDETKARVLAGTFGYKGFGGGVSALDRIDLRAVDLVIVAVAVEALKDVVVMCVRNGLRRLLIEKPGALSPQDLFELQSALQGVRAYIGYNRRYYNSVLMLKEKILEDGGPIGGFFDFTEKEKDIVSSLKAKEVIARWGWANSTHVIDTAFYLMGRPTDMQCLSSGSLPAHSSGTVFAGTGRSSDCLFSYLATWSGGGRWSIDVATRKGRYRLCPMEELLFCAKGQFGWVTIPAPDEDDKKFKPGLYKMILAVLVGGNVHLPDIEEQIELRKHVGKMLGYGD